MQLMFYFTIDTCLGEGCRDDPKTVKTVTPNTHTEKRFEMKNSKHKNTQNKNKHTKQT